VQILQFIRRLIFRFLVRRKQTHLISRRPVTLAAARQIGILFNAGNVAENDRITAFAADLKEMHKEVQLLGYMPKREFGFNYPFPFICDKDTTWYGKPGGGTAGFFMRSPFDLLINFSTGECLPLEYIAATSPAAFRVGFNKEVENANYDLILISAENKDISNLIRNLENYLQ